MSLKDVIMEVKDVGIGTKNVLGSCIFMMRICVFVLKGLSGGKSQD